MFMYLCNCNKKIVMNMILITFIVVKFETLLEKYLLQNAALPYNDNG